MQAKKSGIEHAQIKRLHLFEDHGVAAKILTRDYDRTLHSNMASGGIAEGDLINIWDWLQETVTYQAHPMPAEKIKLPDGAQLRVAGTNYEAYIGDSKVALIKMWGPDYINVDNVTYFDHYGNTLRTDFYDQRGFLSMEQIFDAEDNPLTERMYTPEHRLVYESTYLTNKNNTVVNSNLRVVDYHGETYSFAGIRSLFSWWLDQLNLADGQGSVFIQDRYENDWSILNMHTKAYKFLHIHNVHTNDATHMKTSSLNFNYEFALFNFTRWDGIIVATNKQRDDIVARWHAKVPVYVLPVGVVPEKLIKAPHVPMSARTRHQVIMVARQAPEKRIDHGIKAVKAAHPSVPDIKLDVYGYGSEEMTKKLQKVIDDEGANDYVHLHDYTPSIETVYNNAQALLLTSSAEGFALALLEAISHGVPAIAYNIAYGPSDIIKNDYNGALIQDGAYLDVGQALVNLFKNDDRLQQLSENAYQSSKAFSEEAIWLKWRGLLNDTHYEVAAK